MLPFLAAAGGALASSFLNKGADKVSDKVFGVPSDDVKSGTDLGNDHRQYLDAAFPGTTPVERLGTSSPGAGYSGSEMTARMQMRMKNQEMVNQARIADQTNRAHVLGSTAQFGRAAQESTMNMLLGGRGSSYDTMTAQGRDKTDSEIAERNASARDKNANAVLNEARGPHAGSKAEAEVVSERNRTIGGSMAYLPNTVFKPFQTGYDYGYRTVSDWVYNRASRPRRLGIQR